MTSTIVPPVDLAPGMPSRVVTISATDVTEGGQSMAGATVTFALSDSLDASGGVVIAKTQATITLDSNGKGRIRVPVYTPDAKTWCGSSDWAVLVSASWSSQKVIRVPAGTSAIALSALPNVRPLRGRELQWVLTGAGITVVEGSQWGATVSLDNGVLEFVLTVPPGGTAWWKGMLGTSGNIDTLEDGAYGILSSIAAEGMGLPEHLTGVIESYQTAGVQLYHVKTTGEQRTWQRSNFSSGWTGWQRVDAGSWYKGNLDEQTGTLVTLGAGLYLVRYVNTAEAWDLPQRLLGQLEVVDAGTQRRIRFTPNDAGAGWGDKYAWELATNSSGELRDRWQRIDKTIMRTAPVVLTGPAGEYPQTDTRGSVRIPFTVPTGVSKVRVHMRPWNFRTRKEWGPARMRGVMIAQQSGNGGAITGSRWYAPNVDGQIVTGSEEWVSDWFYVGLTPGNTYLLSYGAEWQDDVRDLVMGTCWSSFELDDWDTDGPVNYQTGWGKFGLQPMDIWIECEAPSSVPVWGYYGSSNTVGVSSGDAVFGAYANVHARKNGAFAAITAAGGWSLMDETMHDSAIINRLGYPARMLDRVYLDLGANIEARDATAAEAIVEMERWMNSKLNSLGNPPVYLLTQISRYTSEETTDTAGTLSDWNEWIRYEATQRPEVVGLIDQAAIFADPEKPWTARVELRASPTDVHFSAMGQKLRAAALDGEVHLPMLTAKNPHEMLGGGVPIFPTLAEAQAWEAANPGRSALTIEPPPDPDAWVAQEPGFDLLAGRVTIPTDEGATYTINGTVKAAGSHAVTVPSTVTVAAVAKPGYTLAGQTEWVQEFEENMSAYTVAALALDPQHYFEFSDLGLPPRDRGSAAGAGFVATSVDTAGPAIGVGPSSFQQVGAGQVFIQSRPSASVSAFSYAAVIHPTAGILTDLFKSWSGDATFQIGHAWATHRVRVRFPGMTEYTHFEAPGEFLRRMHVAFTWDGTTGRAYVDGTEVGSAPATGEFAAQAGTILLQPSAGATVAMAGASLDFTRAWSAAEVASLAAEVGA